ncbi:sulfatase-like hydrolase/transferase [Niabella ginsengisoli]|uniref:Sulfatase-like hydrolase/transferase n=1 Tax=Niabella ginsengisoli TaxID=522298 RepID=A0ABS9SLC4_9BACT|nr:sulfatase-like hydrolase/transferase [Niabella ginsengisoli]MCH5599110.1 sulfatase-like hydrolase/transferase [Niabella ginsengisoli]
MWDKLAPDERTADDAFSIPPFYNNTPAMRKQFARVYNSITLTDKRVAEVLARLKKDKLTDSTIIFFFSDHGEGIPRGKTNGIDLGYRVPFIIWVPPMFRNLTPAHISGTNNELLDFEDLAPTLINLAGGTVPEHMKGRIIMGASKKASPDYIELSTDRSDNGIDMVRSITDGRYIYSRNYLSFIPELRYINYMEIAEIKKIMRQDLRDGKLNDMQQQYFLPRPAEFLFDTKTDIWETKNLVDDLSYKGTLNLMRKRLDSSMKASRDVMLLPEYELASLAAQKQDAYSYHLSDAYRFDEIYNAASLSGFRSKDIAAKQISLLTHTNKIVRYWAALGLRSQEGVTLNNYKKELFKALNDTYAPVAITAAATSYNLFADSASANVLRKAIRSNEEHIALMAINYLLYTKHPEPFVDAVIDARTNTIDEEGYVKWAAQDFLSRLGLMENKRNKDNPGRNNKRAKRRS